MRGALAPGAARPPSPQQAAVIGSEIVLAVAAATGGVAALQSSAPVEGLGILYLLAVLAIAIRRGQLPALIAAVLSVLTFNYLYIAPRHQLTIAHSSGSMSAGSAYCRRSASCCRVAYQSVSASSMTLLRSRCG